MDPFGVKANLLAMATSSFLAFRAHKRKSLTPGGSIAAFAVAFFLVGTGLRGMNLLTFYFISIKATKYKKEIKATIDGTIASHEGSTTRGTSQVLACSLLATILSLVHAIYCGAERSVVFPQKIDADSSDIDVVMLSSQLTCGIVAHHATCLADTLASEMGILSKSSPRLITQPWKRVPSGTNGGVTLTGFFWSAMGGAIIGISTILLDYISGIEGIDVVYAFRMILFSLTCGLVGSIFDSLLGATVQQSYFDPDTKMVYQEEDCRPKSTKLVVSHSMNFLTNELVNLVSVFITTLLGATILGPIFF
uniref:Transmembrane protein 19 n=1 Tax=Pseudo-nitzschia australis TaxID=44445 RepID=A0A7S4AQB7_9STRA|mmetsp:Transcript_3324/g.7166  ORF Transcript_3324/g.7166 Transcript_3324/m.7166 type:complete len:307 (-) Transcript_3324:303-1223(-)|eukprot:CAMPEP_0168167494 /NCGR_PEP_ID=MMETSP0139_2-20121125/2575_1 /TAXON_ID=44445 /ORGANISM="Pseudo-nitzschia australis, Strain 10249 10 AB" /LENGTH=306 /DNA_ID=CAMNT_0008084731 /DNA_START=170 /DNA_END=1090 /DNA_ORIENTATION=-